MFYHKEDFIIRQIQQVAQNLAKLFFDSDNINYEIKDETNYTQSDLIYLKICQLMNNHQYQEAQRLLLDNLNSKDMQYLKLILFFYQKIDLMNDEELEKYNLTREEINHNFQDATSNYNCLI